MNAVNLESQEEAVQRFILSVSSEGTLLKLNGCDFACLFRLNPATVPPQPDDNAEWTDENSRRRVELIDRELAGESLAPEEAAELARLEHQMVRFLDRIAPLPLEPARRLYEELLDKARAALAGKTS